MTETTKPAAAKTDTETTSAAPKKAKTKRRVLTPAERVAKLEQELTEAREKAAKKEHAARVVLVDAISRVDARIDWLTKKKTELQTDLAEADDRLAELSDEGQADHVDGSYQLKAED